MTNPFVLSDTLNDVYLRYLDSPFALRHPDLTQERRQLLSVDGRIFRYPLVEPVPAYEHTGMNIHAVCQMLLAGSHSTSEIQDIAGFISRASSRRPGASIDTSGRLLSSRMSTAGMSS